MKTWSTREMYTDRREGPSTGRSILVEASSLPGAVAKGTLEYSKHADRKQRFDATKHGITVQARRVVLAVALVVITLVFGHSTAAQEQPSFQVYDGEDFKVEFLSRQEIKTSLKHQISDDGAAFTVRRFSQQTGFNMLQVYEFDYDSERGDDKANLDAILVATFKTFNNLQAVKYGDCMVDALKGRQAIGEIELKDHEYTAFMRVAVQGKRVWWLTVTVGDWDTFKPSDVRDFFQSFEIE